MHSLDYLPSGAVCSCGKKFNMWKSGSITGRDAQKYLNITQANARRHADAANKKEEAGV
jgi:hypothetical protein